MNWLDQALEMLQAQPAIGYAADDSPAAEPTALAALALAVHRRTDAAFAAAEALAEMQTGEGSVGIRRGEPAPGWPSSLAVCAWCAVHRDRFADCIRRAAAWLLAHRGRAVKPSSEFGHNPLLIGWSYAEDTHSWVEPTALAVLALRAAGKGNEPAVREGIDVLMDRQLPGGGLNYGNTIVLGQRLRPHAHPTGIALVALAGCSDFSGRVARSVAWLRRSIEPETTPLSLGWAVLGLRAHDALPAQADQWLAVAAHRASLPLASTAADFTGRTGAAHRLALLALAAKGWPA